MVLTPDFVLRRVIDFLHHAEFLRRRPRRRRPRPDGDTEAMPKRRTRCPVAAAAARARVLACLPAHPLHAPAPAPHLHTVSPCRLRALDAAFTCASLAVVRSEQERSRDCCMLTELRLRVAGTPLRSSSSKICGRCARQVVCSDQASSWHGLLAAHARARALQPELTARFAPNFAGKCCAEAPREKKIARCARHRLSAIGSLLLLLPVAAAARSHVRAWLAGGGGRSPSGPHRGVS